MFCCPHSAVHATVGDLSHLDIHRLARAAYETRLWPFLGFLFMPYTTLGYMAGIVNNNGNITGGWLFLVIICALTDLGAWGAPRRRERSLTISEGVAPANALNPRKRDLRKNRGVPAGHQGSSWKVEQYTNQRQ